MLYGFVCVWGGGGGAYVPVFMLVYGLGATLSIDIYKQFNHNK